jgi:NAD-dependent dihydropyrimidine dehydrogenase PreA subunit
MEENIMSDREVYAALVEHLRNWIFDLPESGLLLPMLEMRFTPKEAEFLSRFPHMPTTMEQLTGIYGIPADELMAEMQAMMGKGFIYRVEGRTAVRYSLPDSLFVFYRMPGWKGEEDAWNRELAPLINRYYIDKYGADIMGYPTKGLRAIPIAHTVEDVKHVSPYEDVMAFLERQDYHSVSTCPCRHRHNLDPAFETCKHETENCLHFGRLGRYIVQNDMGREISPEETREILEAAAEAGLVHGISNTMEGMDTICNCCSCCCLFLEPVKSISQEQMGHQRSNYQLEQSPDNCKACGLCAKRCPMGALELKDREGVPVVDESGEKLKARDRKEVVFQPDLCIGCGVCVYKCPTQSLGLVCRGTEEDIPQNMSDIGTRFLTERGCDFSKIF